METKQLLHLTPPGDGFYSTILLSKSLGTMKELVKLVELLKGRVAKCRLDDDDLNDIDLINGAVKTLCEELKEQIEKNTAALLSNAPAE